MKQLYLMIASATVLLSACGKQSGPSAIVSTSDPLQAFQTIVSQCKAALAIPTNEVWPPKNSGGKWIRNANTLATIKYDVRKSDSLVAPIVAVLEVSDAETIFSRSTEAEVRAAELNQVVPTDLVTDRRFLIEFGFVEKKWRLMNVKYGITMLGETHAPTAFSNDGLLKLLPQISTCIPKD